MKLNSMSSSGHRAAWQKQATCTAPSAVAMKLPRRLAGPGLFRPSIAIKTPCSLRTAASYRTVDVEEGFKLLTQYGYRYLDIRSEKDYDYEHLTKPAKCTVNVPIKLRGEPDAMDPNFVDKVKLPKSQKLLVVRSPAQQQACMSRLDSW